MAKLLGTCTATAVDENLTTLIDWTNIQQCDTFIPIIENVGGGSANDITDVQIDSSPDGGTTTFLDDDDGGITVPLSAATGFARGTFAKADTTYDIWIRVRAKCGAGNDTTVSCWLTATATDRLTLDELSDEVRSALGATTDTELLTAVRVYKLIDWTQREIARRVPGLYDLHVEDKTSIAIVTATKSYALTLLDPSPCHIHRIRMVDTTSNINCIKLRFIPLDQLDYENPYPEGEINGKPEYWTRRAGNLEILPVPTVDYNTLPLYIDYSKWPARLTAATDEPALVDADEILIAGAKWRAYSARGHAYRQEADFAKEEFEALLEPWADQQTQLLDWPGQLWDPSEDIQP